MSATPAYKSRDVGVKKAFCEELCSPTSYSFGRSPKEKIGFSGETTNVELGLPAGTTSERFGGLTGRPVAPEIAAVS